MKRAMRLLLIPGLVLGAIPAFAEAPTDGDEVTATADSEVESRGLDPRKRKQASQSRNKPPTASSGGDEPGPDDGGGEAPPKKPPAKRPSADDGTDTAGSGTPARRPTRRPGAGDDGAEPADLELEPIPAAPPQRARANAIRPRQRTFDPKGIAAPTYTFHMSPRARVLAEGGEKIQPDDRAQLAADRARYQRLKRAIQEAAPDSGDFEFDDAKQSIDFKGNYFQLGQLARPGSTLRRELDGLADVHAGEVQTDARTAFDAAFSSPQYRDARRNQLTSALQNAREFDYSAYDARTGPDAQAALRARMQGNAAQKMRALLVDRDGFIVSENHTDAAPKKLLADNMPALKQAGVRTLYLEHFRYGEHQAALDAFNDGGPLPQDRSFQLQLQGTPGLAGLMNAARANGVRIVAIDDAIAKSDRPNQDGPGRFGVERTARMNFAAADIVDVTQRERVNPGKFAMLIGAQHTNTHPGGIPGMAQILNVPAVRVRTGAGDGGPDVELDAENPAQRTPPPAPAQAANTNN